MCDDDGRDPNPLLTLYIVAAMILVIGALAGYLFWLALS